MAVKAKKTNKNKLPADTREYVEQIVKAAPRSAKLFAMLMQEYLTHGDCWHANDMYNLCCEEVQREGLEEGDQMAYMFLMGMRIGNENA